MSDKSLVVDVEVPMKIKVGRLRTVKAKLAELSSEAADKDEADIFESALSILDAVSDEVYKQLPPEDEEEDE